MHHQFNNINYKKTAETTGITITLLSNYCTQRKKRRVIKTLKLWRPLQHVSVYKKSSSRSHSQCLA